MTVSIVIPIYNVEQYLRGCVDSVLANDLTDCEVILVDDGSPDNCGAICDEYAAQHPGVITVIHQENGGLGAARNTGLEPAKGDWMLFVDSDDKLHPQTLATLKTAAQTPGAEVVSFGFFADNGVDPPVAQDVGFPPTKTPFRLSERKDYLLALPSAWMRLWKRDLFLKTGIRYPSRVWYEDIRTTASSLAVAKGIIVLPDSFYYYLSRPDSIMNNKKLGRNREIIDAMDDILGWFRAEGLYETYRDELCALTVQHVLLAGSVRVARIDSKSGLLEEFYSYTEKAFPDWKDNPYSKRLPKLKRLALSLVRRRRYGLLAFLFKLKN